MSAVHVFVILAGVALIICACAVAYFVAVTARMKKEQFLLDSVGPHHKEIAMIDKEMKLFYTRHIRNSGWSTGIQHEERMQNTIDSLRTRREYLENLDKKLLEEKNDPFKISTRIANMDL